VWVGSAALTLSRLPCLRRGDSRCSMTSPTTDRPQWTLEPSAAHRLVEGDADRRRPGSTLRQDIRTADGDVARAAVSEAHIFSPRTSHNGPRSARRFHAWALQARNCWTGARSRLGESNPGPTHYESPDTGPPLLTQSTRALPHRHLGTPCTPSATSACSSVHEPVHAAVGYRLDSASLAPAVAGSRWDVAQIQIADLCAGPCRREPQ